MRDLVFRKHAVLLYAVLILVGTVSAARADTLFTISNTGAPFGAFGTDPNWNYYSTTTDPSINPGAVPLAAWAPAYLIGYNAWPLGSGPWMQNTGNGTGRGNWIGPTLQYMPFNGGSYLTAPPDTYFVYQTSFFIPTKADLSRVVITGMLASDNCDTTVGINGAGLPGTVIGMPSCIVNGDSYSNGHAFEIAGANVTFGSGTGTYFAHSAFTAGWNTIQFVVYNDKTTDSPNPTGLVVWDLQGRVPEVPEPATAGLLIVGIAAASWLRRRNSLHSA